MIDTEFTNSMDFMLGCNYWDSASGTDMWKNWNEQVVEDDLAALEKCGVKHLRIFPNWRDFQPVDKYWHWAGVLTDYYTPKDAECSAPDYVDMRMVRHFKKFCEIADKHGMTITASLLTGWMSGRLFFPPAIANKDLMTDTEALMLTNRYITKLVTEFKDIKNIVMWDLGNECNCMQRVEDKKAAYLWTTVVSNAIRAVDNTRPIASGMHSLSDDESGVWQIKHQGELCDMLTTHPYPSPTIKNDIEPANKMRSTVVPTAQTEWYAGISGKPAMIQEQGSFSDLAASPEAAADFVRVNILSAWANNLKGYLWWCGMEHLLLTEPPYNWSMIERSLGMVYVDRTPKPVGREIKRMSDLISGLPKVTSKRTDGVCVLTDWEREVKATATYTLAKQAGINVGFKSIGDNIGDTDLIIVPSAHSDTFFSKDTYDDIINRVQNGATLVLSVSNVHFCDFEKNFGLRSRGMARMNKTHTAHFPFGDINYSSEKEILLESAGAEILAVNEENNPVFTKFKLGKGYTYLLNFDMEFAASKTYNVYCESPLMSDIYKMVDKVSEKAKDYAVYTNDSRVGVTESGCEDGTRIVTVINYSDEDISNLEYTVKDGVNLVPLYGSLDNLPHCDAAIFKIV